MFATRGATVHELAQQAPSVRFEILTLVRAGDPRVAGSRHEPTGRNARHFTVAFDDLAGAVEALEPVSFAAGLNPYHEDLPNGGDRRG